MPSLGCKAPELSLSRGDKLNIIFCEAKNIIVCKAHNIIFCEAKNIIACKSTQHHFLRSKNIIACKSTQLHQ